MSLGIGVFYAVVIFSIFSLLLFVQHEMALHSGTSNGISSGFLSRPSAPLKRFEEFLGIEVPYEEE